MYLASTPDANDLLEHDPLALVLGMMLDQQIPMEKAFTSPAVLRDRIGHDLDAAEIAAWNPAEFERLFAEPPALHRFPVAMSKRAQILCAIVAEKYDGDAASIWLGAKTGDQLIERIAELPGFGPVKARIFAALVGKQLAVRPKGWREASAPYGEVGTFQSAADVVDQASLVKVKSFKREAKAAAKAGTE